MNCLHLEVARLSEENAKLREKVALLETELASSKAFHNSAAEKAVTEFINNLQALVPALTHSRERWSENALRLSEQLYGCQQDAERFFALLNDWRKLVGRTEEALGLSHDAI